MAKPIIAIVGRPNVGKSLMFNRIVGKRLSIVEDTPGVTRDRIYADAEWRNVAFSLVDTGGIEPKTNDKILKFMRFQAEVAIENADVIILIVDLRVGITAADQEVASILKKSSKNVVVAVNKCDTPGDTPADVYEFYNLGLGEPYPVSALHGYGTGDLLDRCFSFLNLDDTQDDTDDYIRVSVIGKPNVGKSSLINNILGEERVIVSDVAGTTRDSIDTFVDNKFGKYIMIDTAGIRKKAKIDARIEKYSVIRSILAVERSDVCIIMIDATEGVTEQDTKVAGESHNNGKASIIVVNKWDLVEKETNTMEQYKKKVREDLIYMPYAPILFISAKTGKRVETIFEKINYVHHQSHMRITTGTLNSILSAATNKVQPPTDKGKRLKIYYMTQVSVCPPTFVCFCNDSSIFHFSYQRYIENQIREVFGLEGTPIKIIIREKGEKSEGSY